MRVRSLAALGLVFASKIAHADGARVPLDLLPDPPKIDGVLKEWTQPFAPLSVKVSGKSDLAVRVAIGYDENALWVAMEWKDDKIVRTATCADGEDKATLVLAFPDESGNFTPIEVFLFPGDPGNVAGAVRTKAGPIAGATLVENPLKDKSGLTFEAKIPWSELAPAAKVRVGIRGLVRAQDNDGKGVRAVIATSDATAPRDLPPMPTDPERAIEEDFAKERGLTGAPQIDVVADVAGDAQRERVMLWDKYLLVAGPHFRDGKQFHFSDLGDGPRPTIEVKDVTGDGKAEIAVRKKIGTASAYRETLAIDAFQGEALAPLLTTEIGFASENGSIESDVTLSAAGVVIAVGAAKGLTAATYGESPDPSDTGLLLPWGGVSRRTFTWDGSALTKSKEEKQTPGKAPAESKRALPAGPPQPPAPRAPTADELVDGVLALYKKDRKIGAKQAPRIDLAVNVAEGPENERVLVFGRELVVFGKNFLGGTTYITIAIGLDPKDVIDVTSRDLTGDGRAELIVRGVQRTASPKELGTGELDREVVLVYGVDGKVIRREFAVETGISSGDKRIHGTIAFALGDGGKTDLVIGPGRADGWDKSTWPYGQDEGPVSGIVPLILPWTAGTNRYVFRSGSFSK